MRAADDFDFIARRMRELRGDPPEHPKCETCGGGGTVSYGLATAPCPACNPAPVPDYGGYVG